MDSIEKAFRELRDAWFDMKLRAHAHERCWEEREQEEARIATNIRNKAQYDADTAAIIAGAVRSVAPRCMADLDKQTVANG